MANWKQLDFNWNYVQLCSHLKIFCIFFTMMGLPIQENCIFPFIWVFFFFLIAQQFLIFFICGPFSLRLFSLWCFFFFLISGPFSLWLWPFSLWPPVDLSHYGYYLFDSSVKFFFHFWTFVIMVICNCFIFHTL